MVLDNIRPDLIYVQYFSGFYFRDSLEIFMKSENIILQLFTDKILSI